MAGEARSVVVRLAMDVSSAIANARQFGNAVDSEMGKAEKATRKSSEALDEVGASAGKMAAATGAVLLGVTKAAVDWESAWAGVRKTVDGSDSEMAALEGELRGLATTLPATHQEIAGVAEAAGQLGVAREDIASFTETMVNLGETTNLTAEGAATSIAQIANVMGTAGEDIDNFGSALVALGNDGASTEADILAMTQRIAGAGAQIGLAEADILAIANAAASMGIEAEAGGSAISRVFTELAKATASQTPLLEDFAEAAGMSAAEFTKAFEDDPARAFAAFTAGLDRINKSGGDVFSVLDELGLADIRVSQALLSMSASGDLLTDSLDLGAQAWAENTALAKEAETRYDTTAAKIQVAWNKIKDGAIDAGQAALPVLSGITDVVGLMADGFGALPPVVQGTFTGMLAITTLLGGGLWFGTKVISGITTTRTQLAALSKEAPRTAAALNAVTASSKLMAAARGAAVLGGIALASSGAAEGLGISNTASLALMGTIAGPWGAAIGGGVGLLLDMKGATDGTSDALKTMNDALAAADVTAALAGAKDLTDQLADAQNTSGVGDFFSDIGSEFSRGMKNIAKGDILAPINGELEDAADKAAQAQEALTAFGDAMGTDAARAFADAKPILDELGITLEDIAGMDQDGIDGVARAIGTMEEKAASGEGSVDAVGEALSAMGDDASEAGDEVMTLKESLDALLDPQLNLSAATDKWHADLQALNKAVGENGRKLTGQTEGARANREAIRGQVENLRDLVVAQADSGASAGQLSRTLQTGTKRLLDVASAAGLSKQEVREYARQLGLTPDLIKTIIQADASQARGTVEDVRSMLNSIEGSTATTFIRTVRYSTDRGGYTGGRTTSGNLENAMGGLYHAGARFYAAGGMLDRANAHEAEMAPAGAWRIWAEDETGGESYIPHANDHRRPRARTILEQTAGILGGQVKWAADGLLDRGTTGVVQSTPQASLDGLRVTGRLDTPMGPAYIEGIATSAARSVVADHQDMTGSRGRAQSYAD